MRMPFVSDRWFRIWDYNVSHDQMLLRSPKSPDSSSNIDIVFWGVEYVGIPTMLSGIELREAEVDEVALTENTRSRSTEFSAIYLLSSGGKSFVVVAVGFKVLQNTLDIFESSLQYFAGTNPGRDLGLVLAHSSKSSAVANAP